MDLGYKLNDNTYQGIFTTALPELEALRDFEKMDAYEHGTNRPGEP